MRPVRETCVIDSSSYRPVQVCPADRGRISPLRECPIVILAVLLLSALPVIAQDFVSSYPEEPERYDSEYYLDLLTMRHDSRWREFWYARDNVFRLRFGSLNVEQWSLDQELKFSLELSARFRFRYWMEHRYSLDVSDVERNELELEFRTRGPYYLSFYLAPAFMKRENDIGIGFQRRTDTDRYATLAFRVLDFANNFAYEHGEKIEGEENIYTEQPLRFSLSSRDEIGESLRFGIEAFATNRWSMDYHVLDSPSSDYTHSSRAWDGDLWVEYLADPETRFGLEIRAAEFSTRREGAEDLCEHHRIREFLPYLERDDILTGNVTIRAGLQIRRERWAGEGGPETGAFRKDEILPFAAVAYRLSDLQILECGYLADWYDSERTGTLRSADERIENRLSLVYELTLEGKSRVRIIETIDLDREDWGQFSIHDHFFLQVAFGF
jgi:hypothetical protein